MLKQPDFLPTNKSEAKKLAWYPLDIIIITGDAYVDHPGFGSAIIGRHLVDKGFKVGIIDQPDWKRSKDFEKLGKPNLFFGISSGNMDSMVNHYTARKKIRSDDAFSPDGLAGLRPNRALLVYSQKIKSIFKNIPIIIGGIEASLRRIPHYDYWSNKLRNSILFDSRADLLVYGMAEKTIELVAQKLLKDEKLFNSSIPGTVTKAKKIADYNSMELLDFNSIESKEDYYHFFKKFIKNYVDKTLYMKFSAQYLKHNPPGKSLTEKEIDAVYDNSFSRLPHPKYSGRTIPAFEQIKNSITAHRGCFGGCNFCAIGLHQGKEIRSRSVKSIMKEVEDLSGKEFFKGTISDIGGPSANMYGMYCQKDFAVKCKRRSCLYPKICSNLRTSHQKYLKLLKDVLGRKEVKNLFIASGIRFDLALKSDLFIKELAEKYVGGLLKIAPEHKNSEVLEKMYKPDFSKYEKFCKKFHRFSNAANKKQYIIPYLIVGHPGSSLKKTIYLAKYLKDNKLKIKQVQEFTPTPMSISTCMYYTGLDFESGKKINIPKGRIVRLQKALVQWYKKTNKKLIFEALKRANELGKWNYFRN